MAKGVMTIGTRPDGGGNCLYIAVHILRAYLGYKEELPWLLEKYNCFTDAICYNLPRMFPGHEIVVYCPTLSQEARDKAGAHPDIDFTDDFDKLPGAGTLHMFSYATSKREEIAHMVVGMASFPDAKEFPLHFVAAIAVQKPQKGRDRLLKLFKRRK